MSGFSAAERAALDRATVPAMRAGLVRDIVAAAGAGAGAGAPRRRPRGGWRRHGRVLLGAGALVIASATAAATGLLDRLPIRIPGITHAVEPAPKPKHVVRVEKPRPAPARPVALASAPMAEAVPLPPTPRELWRERRAARIAAGLPVRPTLMQRAIAAKLRGLPPAERQAARDEWRRIRALPPAERKIEVARIKADFLARHPKLGQRYEQRLESRAAAAAEGKPPPGATPPIAAPQPPAGPPTPDQRTDRRARWQASNNPQAGALTPDQRLERRRQLREWRQQRAQRLRNGGGQPWRNAREGSPRPVR